MRRILLRDSMMSWPGISLKVEFAPWHWRLFNWYSDDVHWACMLEIGPFELSFMMNQPPFALEYAEPDRRVTPAGPASGRLRLATENGRQSQ